MDEGHGPGVDWAVGWVDRAVNLHFLVDKMSTIWYGMREPVTSIRVDPRPGGRALDIIIWVNHQMAGRIIVERDELKGMIDLFVDKRRGIVYQNRWSSPTGRDDDQVQTSWIGPEEYYGQVISDDYEVCLVHRDDYNMERATHLWDPLSVQQKPGVLVHHLGKKLATDA